MIGSFASFLLFFVERYLGFTAFHQLSYHSSGLKSQLIFLLVVGFFREKATRFIYQWPAFFMQPCFVKHTFFVIFLSTTPRSIPISFSFFVFGKNTFASQPRWLFARTIIGCLQEQSSATRVQTMTIGVQKNVSGSDWQKHMVLCNNSSNLL